MIYSVLHVVVSIVEIVFMYIAMLMVERYVFLEPQMETKKQKWFYAITLPILIASNVIMEDIGQIFLILFSAINIVFGRKTRKIRGFFVVFPVIGVVNGICGPILVAPATIMQMTEEVTLIFKLCLYVIIYIGFALFYIFGTKWRDKFNEEMQLRHLKRWEFALLGGVGIMMMIYSYIIAFLPNIVDPTIVETISENDREKVSFIIDYVNALAKDMTTMVLFVTVICFALSVTSIVVVLQGNKRSYYQQKALTAQIKEKERVERMSIQMVRTLANTIDAKDSYTNGHSTRVARYSVMIAECMGYEGNKLELLEYAALLHDIGKIGIPNEIINKPSRLTDEEYEIIKTHPGIGGKILEEITEIPDIAIGARYHHERFDGRGYPDKLNGLDIPEIARIIGVADAYDAMTSNRSYRELLSQEIVRAEINKGKGTQFDPEIAEVMLTLIDEDIKYTMHE